MKNRLGFRNFIKDKNKMWERYEGILNIADDTFIDELDHLFIALIDELGVKKEKEIKKLKKELKHARQRRLLRKNKKKKV